MLLYSFTYQLQGVKQITTSVPSLYRGTRRIELSPVPKFDYSEEKYDDVAVWHDGDCITCAHQVCSLLAFANNLLPTELTIRFYSFQEHV